MITLDLHGVSHSDAENLVLNFILVNDLPLKIITGRSQEMRDIVSSICLMHDVSWDYENSYNFGALIIKA